MANFGETLRRERELRDISLREIADATKVNLRYLEALEQNRFDILPGGVFNKGFIRAYARFIGADGEVFVDRYLQELAAREARAQGAGAASPVPGLHRPSETPKRRSGSDATAPVQSTQGSGEPAAAIITFSDETARPPAAARDPIFRSVEAAESPAGLRSGSRALTAVVALVGIAGIALLGIWLLRGQRRPAPARRHAGSPAASSTGVAAAEPAGAPPAGSSATPDGTSAAMTTGDGTGPAAGPGAADTNATTAGGGTTFPSPGPEPVTGAGPVDPAARPANREPEPTGREDSIDRTAGPGGAPRPLADPPRAPIAASVAAPLPGVAAPPPGTEPPTPGTMEFHIEATAPVWVQVSCDGDDRLNRALQQGEGVSLRCLSFIRLSVTDIGAVRLTVNGGRCAAPGERGARIEGFVIRAEDAGVICPTQQGAARGRR